MTARPYRKGDMELGPRYTSLIRFEPQEMPMDPLHDDSAQTPQSRRSPQLQHRWKSGDIGASLP